MHNENLWLTQAKMAIFFDVQKVVVSKMETTASDGKNYNTNIYNLDAIIAVGYRINSKKATMFRIWATKVFLSGLYCCFD